MNLPRKDIMATCLVAAAVVVYLLWAAGALPGITDARVIGVVVLVLGFVASASAVVPGFADLLHGNKIYVVATSVIGLVAAVAGVALLVTGSSADLALVMVAMVVLWLIATVHHALLTRTPSPTALGQARDIATH